LPAWISTRESSAPSQGTHNVFIERLWRSLKYECVYLHAFETGSELRSGLSKWIGYYNSRRPHSGLDGRTPDEAYGVDVVTRLAA
jgi:putative transposase